MRLLLRNTATVQHPTLSRVLASGLLKRSAQADLSGFQDCASSICYDSVTARDGFGNGGSGRDSPTTSQNPGVSAGTLILLLGRVYPARVSQATGKTRPPFNLGASLGRIRRSPSPCRLRCDLHRVDWLRVSFGVGVSRQPSLIRSCRTATGRQGLLSEGKRAIMCSFRGLSPVTRSGCPDLVVANRGFESAMPCDRFSAGLS
jgi:hypothetical protein